MEEKKLQATQLAGANGTAEPEPRSRDPPVEEDEDVMERDPTGRFARYNEVIGEGRFKRVFKGFDEMDGIDVAWSKISGDRQQLSPEEIATVVREMEKGLALDHPNIIRCLKCWAGGETINLITEWMASGSLRQYRRRHKHLELKALKKWGKQILKGLSYLHNNEPCIVHGDLRCDKIYVNGHSGEIKIGDLGLATLLPKRFEDGMDLAGLEDPASDIFAFGLCMLELITLKCMDPTSCDDWEERLAEASPVEARDFIAACLGPVEQRPRADELLQHPFLQRLVTTPSGNGADSSARRVPSKEHLLPALDTGVPLMGNGKFKGEDYLFHFTGEVRDGKAVFRLVMDSQDAGEEEQTRTVTFTYDPELDTGESVAKEIAEAFDLGEPDQEICAAAIKEWLAREMPEVENGV